MARKFRLVTTALAVLLGVAFMVGTLVFTDTISKTFDDLFATVSAGTDAQVRSRSVIETGDGGELRNRIDAGRPPEADDEVVLDRFSADQGELDVGDRAQVIGETSIEVTVVGIATFG